MTGFILSPTTPLGGLLDGRRDRRCSRVPRKAGARDDLLDAVESAIEDHVESGMNIGIASTSIGAMAMDKLYRLLGTGKLVDVTLALPSKRMSNRAAELELPQIDPNSFADLDLSIIHAAEFDDELNFVAQSTGASILRPRLVATRSKSLIIVANERDERARIGSKICVEISDLGAKHTLRRLMQLPAIIGLSPVVSFRTKDSVPIRTLDGNRVAEFTMSPNKPMYSPFIVSEQISSVDGVMAHDLFTAKAHKGVIGADDVILERYPTVYMHKVEEAKLSNDQILERLANRGEWKLVASTVLESDYFMKTRQSASHFVQRLLRMATIMDVHVDVELVDRKAQLRVHSECLRSRELNFVDEIQRLATEILASGPDDMTFAYSNTFRRDPNPES
eukprot:CAMPEP_0184746966 /NCGR_PEP_ID=MMETSP0315-20130426/9412_1 /TAXON_ID=101924 /ORGANISM="Rhodosorus marinus, Strain UTEX LB 2760" /LENGTH=391 /DNA_ID=CAMNT_0027219717 /DNA_START=63 /DNA_END=1238 /DNA_ORIENTATION=+